MSSKFSQIELASPSGEPQCKQGKRTGKKQQAFDHKRLGRSWKEGRRYGGENKVVIGRGWWFKEKHCSPLLRKITMLTIREGEELERSLQNLQINASDLHITEHMYN